MLSRTSLRWRIAKIKRAVLQDPRSNQIPFLLLFRIILFPGSSETAVRAQVLLALRPVLRTSLLTRRSGNQLPQPQCIGTIKYFEEAASRLVSGCAPLGLCLPGTSSLGAKAC